MKVDGFGSITSTTNTSKKRGVSNSGNFADLLAAAETGETSQATQTGDIGSTALVSNFLALQEVPDEFLARKKLLQQGNNMLDTLEKLRRQLLGGQVSLSTLRDIEKEISQKKELINDPKLMAIMDDIELRAAVELAKLQMSTREA